MIYLDSSALLKLVRQEQETAPLLQWLGAEPDMPLVTSELGRAEVLRAARRISDDALAVARGVLDNLDLVPLDRWVQDRACDIGEPVLRTLDALHLASAGLLDEALAHFVAYDHRLLEAASRLGLPVAAPGRSG